VILSCTQGTDEPEVPNDSYEPFIFEACGCGCDELEDGFIWPKKLIVWDYPLMTGMMNYDDLQIPENVLYSLSTEDLMEICLQWPYLIQFDNHYSFTVKSEALPDQFNGFKELFNRKGVSDVLLRHYQELLRNIAYQCRDIDFNYSIFRARLRYTEILLANNYPQDNINYKKVLQSLLAGYEAYRKYNYIAPDGYVDSATNYFARANIIIRINPQSIDMFPNKENNKVFSNGSISLPYEGAIEETRDIINKLSYQLI